MIELQFSRILTTGSFEILATARIELRPKYYRFTQEECISWNEGNSTVLMAEEMFTAFKLRCPWLEFRQITHKQPICWEVVETREGEERE